jgi:hypothetical protein
MKCQRASARQRTDLARLLQSGRWRRSRSDGPLCFDIDCDFCWRGLHGRDDLHRQRIEPNGQVDRGIPRGAYAELWCIHRLVDRDPLASSCAHLVSLLLVRGRSQRSI